MLLHVSEFHSFLRLNHIALYVYITFCLSSHSLMNIPWFALFPPFGFCEQYFYDHWYTIKNFWHMGFIDDGNFVFKRVRGRALEEREDMKTNWEVRCHWWARICMLRSDLGLDCDGWVINMEKVHTGIKHHEISLSDCYLGDLCSLYGVLLQKGGNLWFCGFASLLVMAATWERLPHCCAVSLTLSLGLLKWVQATQPDCCFCSSYHHHHPRRRLFQICPPSVVPMLGSFRCVCVLSRGPLVELHLSN